MLNRPALLVLLASIPLLIPAAGSCQAQAAGNSEEELDRAKLELAQALEGTTNVQQRLIVSARLAFSEESSNAVKSVALRSFKRDALSGPNLVLQVYDKVPPAAHTVILDLYRENWSYLGMNTNPHRDNALRISLGSPLQEVRRAAAHLAATRPFPRITHHMIDAAMREPDFMDAAFYTVAINREHRAIRWIIDSSVHSDAERRALGLWVISRVGPAAKRMVLERLNDPDPEMRSFALTAFLGLAAPEDASLLHRWLDTWSTEDPDGADAVLEALAELETGRSLIRLGERREYEPFWLLSADSQR